jgi:hypothetical protein
MSTTASLDTASPEELVNDPHWFPEDMDPRSRTVTFVRLDRDAIASKAFLRETTEAAPNNPRRRIGLDALIRLTQGWDRPAVNFIWHTAFCCSTLIARTLDRPGHSLTLREPRVIMALAAMKRMRAFPNADAAARANGTILKLLARGFAPGERVTIKPANAANNIIADLAAVSDGNAVFLYSDVRGFMIAVAQRGENRRSFVRRLFAQLMNDEHHQQRLWNAAELFDMSDLQIAALVWHMQIDEFHRSLSALSDRVAALDCDAFLAAPATSLAALDQHFGLDLGREHIADVIRGPLLRRNAKAMNEPLGYLSRRQAHREIAPMLAKDIEAVTPWSYSACRSDATKPAFETNLLVPGTVG